MYVWHMFVCMYVSMCMDKCMRVHMYMHICMYVDMWMSMIVYILCMSIYMHMSTRIIKLMMFL